MHRKLGLYQGALYGGLFDMHVSSQNDVPLYLLRNKWYYPFASMAHDPHKEGDDIFIYYFYLQPQRIIPFMYIYLVTRILWWYNVYLTIKGCGEHLYTITLEAWKLVVENAFDILT